MPERIDLFKLHKDEYAAPKEPALLTIKPAKYLSIEGGGKPGGAEFQAQIGALYGVAYTIKMTRKFAGREPDYKVPPLEGLYWNIDAAAGTMSWKLLVRVPGFIGPRDLKNAAASLREKGKDGPFGDVRLETVKEGRCVQLLHVGPYTEEAPAIARMQAFAESQGLRPRGEHHEIYLNDPRRVAPAKLKTILRQPVQ